MTRPGGDRKGIWISEFERRDGDGGISRDTGADTPGGPHHARPRRTTPYLGGPARTRVTGEGPGPACRMKCSFPSFVIASPPPGDRGAAPPVSPVSNRTTTIR
ncbi:hypothetical protein GCM10023074_53970 [Microbispora amethystogenes]|uniref:Uncharacterized protein n=1 Tax=Microbispora amethystogenes TaxID=1427754 RepID=A0ABQ4FHL0_9ACTN|nr:hypothetical protein Mam01_44390 [Microbispora amethystogenes]